MPHCIPHSSSRGTRDTRVRKIQTLRALLGAPGVFLVPHNPLRVPLTGSRWGRTRCHLSRSHFRCNENGALTTCVREILLCLCLHHINGFGAGSLLQSSGLFSHWVRHALRLQNKSMGITAYIVQRRNMFCNQHEMHRPKAANSCALRLSLVAFDLSGAQFVFAPRASRVDLLFPLPVRSVTTITILQCLTRNTRPSASATPIFLIHRDETTISRCVHAGSRPFLLSHSERRNAGPCAEQEMSRADPRLPPPKPTKKYLHPFPSDLVQPGAKWSGI